MAAGLGGERHAPDDEPGEQPLRQFLGRVDAAARENVARRDAAGEDRRQRDPGHEDEKRQSAVIEAIEPARRGKSRATGRGRGVSRALDGMVSIRHTLAASATWPTKAPKGFAFHFSTTLAVAAWNAARSGSFTTTSDWPCSRREASRPSRP